MAKGSGDTPSREQRVVTPPGVRSHDDTTSLERATRERGVNHALKTKSCRAWAGQPDPIMVWTVR